MATVQAALRRRMVMIGKSNQGAEQEAGGLEGRVIPSVRERMRRAVR
jgi:hypothetical protein